MNPSDDQRKMRVMFDPQDEELREELARASYYQQKIEERAADREHELGPDVQYACLTWESLTDAGRRPYRTAVAVALDTVASMAA